MPGAGSTLDSPGQGLTDGAEFGGWPKSGGFRMPAEWESHAATWLSWPHNRQTWPDALAAVESAMADMAAALAECETVRINVLDEAHERHVARLLRARAPSRRIVFHRIPTDDAWCRDHGPVFLTGDRSGPGAKRDSCHGLLAADFEFNAWGGKYTPWDLDAASGRLMAGALGIPRFEPGMVLEGGSIDVNGCGALLATEQCLLNPNRNPHLDRCAIEERLKRALGVSRVIWLGGGIEGDDTDGHVDGVARFVGRRRILACVEDDPTDRNHRALCANRERLEDARLPGGQRPEIVDLPMPAPVYRRGHRLPASYANFYIANEIVIVPGFGGRGDDLAGEIVSECFPSRRVVTVDCRRIVIGLGAVHCLTQQVPAQANRPPR